MPRKRRRKLKPKHKLSRGYVYERGRIWWVKFYDRDRPGEPIRESTGCYEEESAVLKANEIMREYELEKHGATKKDPKPHDLVDQWYTYMLEELKLSDHHCKRSATTAYNYLDDCKIKSLKQINRRSAEKWLMAKAKAKEWSARTRNKERNYLKAWGRWLFEREELVARNPFLGIPTARKDPVRIRRGLTPGNDLNLVSGEGRVLVDSAPWPHCVLYLTALTTGYRRKELGSLCWGAIDWEVPGIRLPAELAKARRSELIPLVPETYEALRSFKQHLEAGHTEPPVSVAEILRLRAKGLSIDKIRRSIINSKKPKANRRKWHWASVKQVVTATPREISPEEPVFKLIKTRFASFDAAVKRDFTAAGIVLETDEGIASFHSLRATFASRLREICKDPHTAARLTRHANFQTTYEHYQKWSPNQLLEAMLGPEEAEVEGPETG